jgi:uracil-DNA glycosylase
MSKDDLAAADAVCAYLSNQFGLARRKVVLLFGQSAARFVIDPQRNFDDLRGLQPGLHSEQWFAVSHGLNELMKLPALKSEAWKDLSPLRSKLK